MSSWNFFFSFLAASWLVAWTDMFESLFSSSATTKDGPVTIFAFLDYFDDSYNYIKHPTFNTLKPYTKEHLWSIIMHPGINVYEPVSSLIKAALIDLIGFHAHALHIASMVFHSINLLLLWCWVNVVIQNDDLLGQQSLLQSFRVSAFIMISCLFFYIHPLNMEVIGWLSAQGYTYSLFFSLLSSLAVEQIISNIRIQRETMGWEIIMTFTYVIACLCKAPAVVLPGIHITRMAFATIVFRQKVNAKNTRTSVQLQLSSLSSSTTGWMVLIRSLMMLGIVCCIMYHVISQANDNTGAIIPPFESWVTTIIRSIATIANFAARIWIPIDLRGHYRLEEEFFYSWSIALDPTTDLFWKLWLVLSFTFVTAIQCLLLSMKQSSIFMATIPLGWCWFLLLWLPGCGLVAHGWASLGSDRYNYFPLAYIAPSIVHLLLLLTNDDDDDRVHSIDLDLMTSNDVIHSSTHHLNDGQQQTNTNGNNNPQQIGNEKNNVQLPTSQPVNQQLHNSKSQTNQNTKHNSNLVQRITKKSILFFSDILFSCFVLIRLVVILLFCGMYLVALAGVSRVQLPTWINDKALLVRCVTVDPTDYDCHQYLGDLYGYHDNDHIQARIHTDAAIQHVPTSNSKALMFKAQMYFFTNRQDDACDVVEHAFTMARHRMEQQQQITIIQSNTKPTAIVWPWNFRWFELPDGISLESEEMTIGGMLLPDKLTIFERRMYPLVLNNWLICHAIHNWENMTDSYIQYALTLIQQAQQDVQRSLENKHSLGVPEYVMESLIAHEEALIDWRAGKRVYTASFVW